MSIAEAEQKLTSVRHHIVLREVHRNVLEEYAKVINPSQAESELWKMPISLDFRVSVASILLSN